MGRIERGGGHEGHRAAALGVGAHRHQHALHVGVVDDRRAAGQRAVHRARLHTVLRVGHGLLVGPFGHRDALHAHRVARGVHHDEHVLEAAVLLADQLANRAAVVAELQHGRRAGLDAQLVLDAHAMRVVARAQRAVGVDEELGHDEQADALHALGCAGHAREHEVHDVLRHVVLAIGDEDLRAEDLERTVGLRLGTCAHQCQVRAGLRLGQIHGAGPLAADHLRDEGGLLLRRAGGQQGLDRTVGQQRAQRETEVGAVEHLAAGRTDGLGQTLAAEVRWMLQALPAALGVLAEGLLEARRGGHLAVVPRRGVLVAFPVQRCDHAFVELGAFLEHGLRRVEAGVLEAGQLGHFLEAGEFLHAEQHVLDRRDVAHDVILDVNQARKSPSARVYRRTG